MSTAVAAASFMNIPLAHIQGGEITGNIDEKVRHSITKLADLHLVSTEKSKERVIKWARTQIVFMLQVVPQLILPIKLQVREAMFWILTLLKNMDRVGSQLDWSNGYLVVMQHPVTTEFHLAEHQILETLKAVCGNKNSCVLVLAKFRCRDRLGHRKVLGNIESKT